MRHINPSESTVMQEFERLAAEKGWIVKQASQDHGLAEEVRRKVNEVGAMLPSNVSLDHVVPVPEDGDVRRAVEVVAHAASMHEIAKSGSGEYRATIDMMADDDFGRVLSGLESLESMLKKAMDNGVAVNQLEGLAITLRNLGVQVGDKTTSKGWRQALLSHSVTDAVEPQGYTRRDMANAATVLEKDMNNRDWVHVAERAKYINNMFTIPKPSAQQRGDTDRKGRRERSPARGRHILALQGPLARFTGIAVSRNGKPDGWWGKMTAAAWNKLVGKYGSYMDISKVDPRGRQVPPVDSIVRATEWLIEMLKSKAGQKKETVKNIVPKIPVKVPARKSFTLKQRYSKLSEDDQKRVRNLVGFKIKPGQNPTRKDWETVITRVEKENATRGSTSGNLADDETPLSSRAEVEEHIPLGLVNREMEFPMITEPGPGKSFKPKLPSWMKDDMPEEHIPEYLITERESKPTPSITSPYVQLNERQQKFVRSLISKYMAKGMTEEEAKRIALMRVRYASTVRDIAKLANDLETIGETKAAMVVDKQLVLYRKAAPKLYDITGETGEQLIGQAHPGGGPTIIPAAEEGGKVETIIEEQKKLIDKVTKTPTGKYAFVARQLVSLAGRLDAEGKREASALVDKTIMDLSRTAQSNDDSLEKKSYELKGYLKTLIALINSLESVVKDQWGKNDTDETRQQYGVISISEGAGKHVEYDTFLTDIRKALGKFMRQVSELVKNKRMMVQLHYLINRLLNGLKSMSRFYIDRGEDADGSFSSQVYDQIKFTSKLLIRFMIEETGYKKPSAVKSKSVGGKPPKKGPSSPKLTRYQIALTQFRDQLKAVQWDEQRMKRFNRAVPKGQERTTFLKSIIDWANQEIKNDYAEHIAAKRYLSLLSKLVRPLARLGVISGITASKKMSLKKVSDDKKRNVVNPPKRPVLRVDPGAPAGAGLDTPPAMPQLRIQPKGRRGKSPLQHIGQIQSALRSLGPRYDVGIVDEKWGPKTRAAWENLRADLMKRKIDIGVGPSSKGLGPTPQQVQRAIRGINYMRYIGGGSGGGTVNIAPGVVINETSLQNADSFMRALASQPKSGIRGKTRKEIHSKENIARAKSLLAKYADEFMSGRNEDVRNMFMQGKNIRSRAAVLRQLQRQLVYSGRLPPGGFDIDPLTGKPRGQGEGLGSGGWGRDLGREDRSSRSNESRGDSKRGRRDTRGTWVKDGRLSDRDARTLEAFNGIEYSMDAEDYVNMLFGYGAYDDAGEMANWALYQAPVRFANVTEIAPIRGDKYGWKTARKYIPWAMRMAGQFSATIAQIRPPNVSPSRIRQLVRNKSGYARILYRTVSAYAGRS